MIGYSSIRSTYIGVDLAEEAGKRKGATVLLYKQIYVGTATGTRVLPWYHQGDTYTMKQNTQGSVNIGSSGYVLDSNYSGTAKYSQSTTTTIKAPDYYTYHRVPYSKDYYDQYAMYLAKDEVKPVGRKMTLKRKCPMWDKPDLLAGKHIGDTESIEVYVIERANSEFYLIRSGNKTGYIYKDNLK
ncbi:hypothetical protein [Flavobacterium sp.]|uniref:hypothetical protein n=1 Tax=Flavobacterium sp. TaxID=239 RepID=UPI003A93D895